jgi:hypothetical protein
MPKYTKKTKYLCNNFLKKGQYMSSTLKTYFAIFAPKNQNVSFLVITTELDILCEAYCAPGVVTSTACQYNVGPVQIQQSKNSLAGMDGDIESSEVLYISSKGQAKRLFTMGRAASMLSIMELSVSCLIP